MKLDIEQIKDLKYFYLKKYIKTKVKDIYLKFI